jgi:hypothetical protein
MAAKLGDYTYAQLVERLDSDEAPPAPLTRKEIREAVQHLDREAAATKERVMLLREQQKEQQFQTVVTNMMHDLQAARGTIRQQEAALAALRWELTLRIPFLCRQHAFHCNPTFNGF